MKYTIDGIWKRIKKGMGCCLISALIAVSLCGCRGTLSESTDKVRVVCTIFPQYDWARSIIADSENVELTLLVDNGVDLHSFQPTAQDILTISGCDLFIYVGGESDAWVEDALEQAENKNMIILNMMDILGEDAKEEEIVEGMETADLHLQEENGEEAHDEEAEYDEHVWLSLKNAQIFCDAIAEALGELDEENKTYYQDNAASYNEKLLALDETYKSTLSTAKKDTILVGDRFPFRYLTDDYDIGYYAAFAGCSAETEASFETVGFLAEKLDEMALSAIIVPDGSTRELAKTIVECSETGNQNILVLNSLQSVTRANIDEGWTYISVMEENLEVLRKALECD